MKSSVFEHLTRANPVLEIEGVRYDSDYCYFDWRAGRRQYALRNLIVRNSVFQINIVIPVSNWFSIVFVA